MYRILLYTFALLFLACGENQTPNIASINLDEAPSDSTKMVLVVNPAGELPNKTFNADNQKLEQESTTLEYLLPPFHQGIIGSEGEAVVLLAKPASSGDYIEAEQVAILEVMQDNQNINIPIYNAVKSEHKMVSLDNFSDFLLKYPGLSDQIRTWYVNHLGWKKIEFVQWSNSAPLQVKR